MIKYNHVYKTYPNNVRGLQDVTLTIDDGEMIFVTGHSGAGKTTLLKLLLKAEEPTDGDIVVKDSMNGELNLRELVKEDIPYYRRTVGTVFQDYLLLEDKTVWENVAFAMRIIGAEEREVIERVSDILIKMNLMDKRDCYPSELSGGEQQKTAIARAIINNPLVVIADEPTGNLDAEASKEIIDIFKEINNKGKIVIIATHDNEVISRENKRVIKLEDGVLVGDYRK